MGQGLSGYTKGMLKLNDRHLGVTLAIVTVLGMFLVFGRSLWEPVVNKIQGKRSVAEVLTRYGDSAVARLQPYFDTAGVDYPPRRGVLLADKAAQMLELWASSGAEFRFIRRYNILRTSGRPGPKLREGDFQVPEGIYRIIGLNPNSAYHLSMKLDYPNDFDLTHAQAEGRSEPGSNIFIHGKNVSIGCLAMGDTVIEELFVLAAQVGIANFKVVIAPTDPRREALIVGSDLPPWTADLYRQIATAFAPYQQP